MITAIAAMFAVNRWLRPPPPSNACLPAEDFWQKYRETLKAANTTALLAKAPLKSANGNVIDFRTEYVRVDLWGKFVVKVAATNGAANRALIAALGREMEISRRIAASSIKESVRWMFDCGGDARNYVFLYGEEKPNLLSKIYELAFLRPKQRFGVYARIALLYGALQKANFVHNAVHPANIEFAENNRLLPRVRNIAFSFFADETALENENQIAKPTLTQTPNGEKRYSEVRSVLLLIFVTEAIVSDKVLMNTIDAFKALNALSIVKAQCAKRQISLLNVYLCKHLKAKSVELPSFEEVFKSISEILRDSANRRVASIRV